MTVWAAGATEHDTQKSDTQKSDTQKSDTQEPDAVLVVRLDHLRVYTDDVETAAQGLCNGYGFDVYAEGAKEGEPRSSIGLGKDQIRIVLTEASDDDIPASVFTMRHGEGVADIGLATHDARAAFAAAVARGATVVAEPSEHEGFVTATIGGFADLVHTFVQRPAGMDQRSLPGMVAVEPATPAFDSGLHEVDHLAVILEADQLDTTVEFYERVLGFRMIFTEYITVATQAMNSKVVQSASGSITLTLLEPDTSRDPGQIDAFIKNFGGGGVQHVAFASDNIVASVRQMSARGTEFLQTPAAYYHLLAERMQPNGHSIEDLKAVNVLADEDQNGQLFQLFAKSTCPRNTLFFEVIERVGAETFGTNNIRSLYEAVEMERLA